MASQFPGDTLPSIVVYVRPCDQLPHPTLRAFRMLEQAAQGVQDGWLLAGPIAEDLEASFASGGELAPACISRPTMNLLPHLVRVMLEQTQGTSLEEIRAWLPENPQHVALVRAELEQWMPGIRNLYVNMTSGLFEILL